MDKNKVIYFPLKVPNNNFCWDGETPCQFLDNEGGHPTCDMKIGSPVPCDEGYAKPYLCLELSEFTDKIKTTIHPKGK